jgi:hypothetical protein
MEPVPLFKTRVPKTEQSSSSASNHSERSGAGSGTHVAWACYSSIKLPPWLRPVTNRSSLRRRT